MILAGDIGGTKTNLALFEHQNGTFVTSFPCTFESARSSSLKQLLQEYFRDLHVPLDGACFGVAGPVMNNKAHLTNLPWEVNSNQLSHLLGLPEVQLINDLEANAYGIDALPEADIRTLNKGEAIEHANRAVISAGTGLGEAFMVWDGKKYRAFASEGGHTDFAPRTQLESALLDFLQMKYGHVSFERVLSGPGLHNLYEFIQNQAGVNEPQWLTERFAAEDSSAVIAETGIAGTFKPCVEALDLFVAMYGSEAGNLALKMLSLGGVFIGGGIAPKILPKLKEDVFMRNFHSKGRMSNLLEQIPVKVILNGDTALIGAARYAYLMLQEVSSPPP